MAEILIYSILTLGLVGAVILWVRLRRIARELERISNLLARYSRSAKAI